MGICVNRHVRLNMAWRPIVEQYREGKVKSMPTRQVKKNLKPCAYKQLEGYAIPQGVECLIACLSKNDPTSYPT